MQILVFGLEQGLKKIFSITSKKVESLSYCKITNKLVCLFRLSMILTLMTEMSRKKYSSVSV